MVAEPIGSKAIIEGNAEIDVFIQRDMGLSSLLCCSHAEKIKNNNLSTIVLIDEAHLLDSDAFIDLRLLVSSAIEEFEGLKIILFGHSDIKKN
jgi:hypothetical protein